MKTIPLGGAWGFARRGETPAPAVVPGCNYHDLLRLGKIEDPFTGENESKSYWVGEADFDYTRSFCLEAEDLEADRITLCCGQLDTLCRVYVNGMLAGKGKNSHIGYEFDVSGMVRAGENALRIEFDSPVRYAREMARRFRTPPDINGSPGRTHIRKAQCHFGWDWGPRIPVSGITGEISLRCCRGARLLPMEISQRHAGGKVWVSAKAGAELYREGAELRLTLLSPEGDALAQGRGDTLETLIENPRLWWTRELGAQPLYTLRAQAFYDGAEVDAAEYRIGLRTIELNREKDRYGHNFQFILNGAPIFAKGANYIPPDSFPDRATAEVKRGLLEECLRANMNMVRVWGGGYYESDEFYDMCDSMGLLVWQDFMFACAPYPFDGEGFLQNVRDEVAYNVKRLRHHASLALWCGNNEIEAMSVMWAHYRKLTRWQGKFFWEILPAWVREYDGRTAYTATSPTGEAYLKGAAGDKDGDTHLWHVWHGLQPLDFYRGRQTRFCSEFGLESLPSMKAVRAFAGPGDCDVESPVFNAHQKCRSGNQKILYYLLSQYRLPKAFGDILYLSQLNQAECVRDATEHWRRSRGRCNGSLYWQLNDCWPVCSWSGVDYAGRHKALQYAARRFFEPVAVSIQDSGRSARLYMLNDTREDRRLSIAWQLMDFSGRVVESEQLPPMTARALSSRAAAELSFNRDPGGLVLRVQLKDGGQVVSARTLLFGKEKELKLPRCRFAARAEVRGGLAHITVQSDKFARAVFIESDLLEGNLSDNFIDLFPGEPVTFTACAGGAAAEDIPASLRFTTVGNIDNVHSRLRCAGRRLRISLKPVNLGAWVVFRLGLA
ncbi:MAG: glycoside hydrolase family 2 protein [Firmicutes bacterium]|nr:glycoside hydrolase family 2 protein [Bacillota bacterium]